MGFMSRIGAKLSLNFSSQKNENEIAIAKKTLGAFGNSLTAMKKNISTTHPQNSPTIQNKNRRPFLSGQINRYNISIHSNHSLNNVKTEQLPSNKNEIQGRDVRKSRRANSCEDL